MRSNICLAFLLLVTLESAAQQSFSTPQSTGRKVSVGGYSLFLDCTGNAPGPTVVLIASTDAHTWDKVQPEVTQFAKVCSYDRMGTGQSDVTIPPTQSAEEVVDDLHTLLLNGAVKPPYILVGHSIGGIYARKFAELYPATVAGLVFVDSADEEQVWRFAKISHSLLFEYPGWPNQAKMARLGFLPPGGLLKWHQDVPLIVLVHGITWPRGTFKGMSESEYADVVNTWHAMQLDLSSRSKYGELRVAEKSGHFIQLQQPKIVIQATHDVLGKARALGHESR